MRRIILPLAIFALCVLFSTAFCWEYLFDSRTGQTVTHGVMVVDSTFIPNEAGWDVSKYAVDRIYGYIYADLDATIDTVFFMLEGSNSGGKDWSQLSSDACSTLYGYGVVRTKDGLAADGGKNIQFWTGEDATYYDADSSWFPYQYLRVKTVSIDADSGGAGAGTYTVYYTIIGKKD